ncbi:hypothetical protein [Anabaena sp. UHCC 0399]|nr:hypothetical protein [Anabaena sp. UHCC 0399]MEA5568551.1 hypothetical protein [Anabaena sp. UHCC 0399]
MRINHRVCLRLRLPFLTSLQEFIAHGSTIELGGRGEGAIAFGL